MLGFVPNGEALKIIANSRALVLPTQWYEGFPMSIVEAFSVGTPVICSDLGNAGSIVEEGITGAKFIADDIEEIIFAVRRCRGMCKKAFNEYQKKYTEGNTITYSDVELFYGDPFKLQKLDHTFWWNFKTSMDKIDDQQINYFFGRDGVKNIKRCAENAQKILKELFRDWVGTIHISEEISKYAFGDNVLFVNFNYTDTLLKRFGVKAVNEFHIHGMANEKESIIVGHATHPEYPYEPLRMFKNKP